MRRKLIEKIKSQTGASLSLALLLFLVCAAVGSVVLTAGTGAAGRLSKMAETDQRYYAVTSAARFFNDLLEADESTVTLERVETVTDTTKYNAAGRIDDPTSESEYSVKINGLSVDNNSVNTVIPNLGIISRLSLSLYGVPMDYNTAEDIDAKGVWDTKRTESATFKKTYTLQFQTSPNDEAKIIPTTKVEALFEYKEGKLTVKLTDTIGDSDHYALVISAEPVFTENTSVKTTETSFYNTEEQIETKVVTKTTTKTSVLKWGVTGIEKAVSGNE